MKLKMPPTLIHPSTRAFFREARQIKGFSFFDKLHGYIYGRWPFFYISVGTGQHPLTRWIAPFARLLIKGLASKSSHSSAESLPDGVDPIAQHFAGTYHGKVVPLEAAKTLVTIHEEIRLTVPESVIPFEQARDIILQNPDHIAVLDCPCRAAREKPCLPLDVCLIVGEPFVGFIASHQPQRTRRISQQEAVEILQAEDKRGHVHHAFFKDAMLGRFYAICNCCSCCCGAMQAQRSGTPMLISSGYRAVVDLDKCRGCQVCVSYCQFGAISARDDRRIEIDPSVCMGCGVCVGRCARDAISLQRDPTRPEPLVDLLQGYSFPH